MFSEPLEKYRDFLETGNSVVITAEATMETEQLKLLCRSVQPIDAVVADAGSAGLKIFVDDPAVISSVANVLEGAVKTVTSGGRGPIHFCLLDPGLPGEVELETGLEFPVNPQIKGAIKSLGGVVTVEEF